MNNLWKLIFLFFIRHERSNSVISKKELERTQGYLVENKITSQIFLDEIKYDKNEEYLSFKLIQEIKKPKITRYKTINYQRYPIYEDYSIRTKTIKKFSKKIIPERFVNVELSSGQFKDMDFLLKEKLIKLIGIKPKWYIHFLKLDELSRQIVVYKNELRNFDNEKKSPNLIEYKLKEKKDNFLLFFILGLFLLFIPFFFYTSKKKAKQNKKINHDNEIFNIKEKERIKKFNKKLSNEIIKHNQKINNLINKNLSEIKRIKNYEYKYVNMNKHGWIPIKKASLYNYPNIKEKYGIYIIWNKNKDKYYVGQSKRIDKRLCDHFKNGEVKNIIFAKDWYAGDRFFYKSIPCTTKDELDRLEKEYIEKYNSFIRGYNKTSGNV